MPTMNFIVDFTFFLSLSFSPPSEPKLAHSLSIYLPLSLSFEISICWKILLFKIFFYKDNLILATARGKNIITKD